MSDHRNDPNGFFLTGKRLEPSGLEWELAPRTLKHAYWKVFGMAAARAKDAELAAGLDKSGSPLRPITDQTRIARTHPYYSPMGRADPNAPVLTPCYSASRTRSLLRWQAHENGVAFWWDFDPHTDASWGVILNYHRMDGRDVFGLSPNGLNRAKREAQTWWDAYLNRIPAATRKPERADIPAYKPRTDKKRPPVAPYSTGPRFYRDGKLVRFEIPEGTHIDRITGIGLKPIKR